MTERMVMYKAVDKLDNKMSLFAVCGDRMSVSFHSGEEDPWLNVSSEEDIELDSAFDFERMKHPILLLWATRKTELPVAMYKAVDRGDRQLSYFAVRGERMAATFVLPETSYWSKAETFGDFDDRKSSDVDFTRMVNPEVIWSQ
jgi:hypothetical protein